MKFAFLLLLTATSISAMQNFEEVQARPKSKHDCFLAYTKFQALLQTCKHDYVYSGASRPDVDKRQDCVFNLYELFLKECTQEKDERINSREKVLSLGRDPRAIR